MTLVGDAGTLQAHIQAIIQRRRDLIERIVNGHREQPVPCAGICHQYVMVSTPGAPLAACEADLQRLQRHSAHGEACGYDGRSWPCPDVEDLIEVYQVRRP